MKNKDKLFMNIAKEMAQQSTCIRRQVGAVLVKNDILLSTGYNGAPRKMKHADEVGCLRTKLNIPSGEKSELCRGVHAEINCIIQCALKQTNPDGATLYCTTHPCCWCAKTLINAGIKKVIFLEDYDDQLSKDMLKEANVEVIQYAS